MDAKESAQRIENGLADIFPGQGVPGIGGPGSLSPQNFGYGTRDQESSPATMFQSMRNVLISNYRQLLSQAYAEIGLIGTFIDVPVDDALRGGVDIKSAELDEDDIELLRVSLERDGDLTAMGYGAKWARLFGGGGVIIMDDRDLSEALDIDNVAEGSDITFRPFDLWELSPISVAQEDGDATDHNRLAGYYEPSKWTYYGKSVHSSRVLRMRGKEPPSYLRNMLRGWGLSSVEALVRSINQYLKSTDLAFDVMDEFKLDIFSFKGLVNTLLSPGGDQAIRQRVAIASSQKNYNNAIVLDADDKYDSKQLSFTGISEAMTAVRMQVASDVRMPITKLFGISATGFNSGQDDIEVYNSMVESQIRTPLKHALLIMIEIKCQVLFGFIPEDLSIEFKSLRVLSDVDTESVKTQKFNRVIQAKSAGEITDLEFRNAVNKGKLFDITLDIDDAALSEIEEQKEAAMPDMGGGEPEGDTEPDDDEMATKAKKEVATRTLNAKLLAAGASPLENSLGIEQLLTSTTAKTRRKVKSKYYRAGIQLMPGKYSMAQRIKRALNSVDFDKAAYAADGGDTWIDPRREEFFKAPTGVNQGLWAQARQATHEIYGSDHWQYQVWFYKKLGGQFT